MAYNEWHISSSTYLSHTNTPDEERGFIEISNNGNSKKGYGTMLYVLREDFLANQKVLNGI